MVTRAVHIAARCVEQLHVEATEYGGEGDIDLELGEAEMIEMCLSVCLCKLSRPGRRGRGISRALAISRPAANGPARTSMGLRIALGLGGRRAERG